MITCTNEQELESTISILNRNSVRETIKLVGSIQISKHHLLTSPISIEGPCLLEYSGGSLNWAAKTTGWYALKNGAFSETLLTDAPVTPGSLIICQSNDKINVEPHTKGGTQHPQEIHMVNFINGKTVGVESFLVDQMDGNISLLNPIENVSVKNISIVNVGKQASYSVALKFDGVANLVLEDINIKRNGAGCIWLNNAYNCNLNRVRIDGTHSVDNVYGLVFATVNNVFVTNCVITGCRHAITTTAGISKGVARWGTPLNILIDNCIFNVPTKDNKQTRVGIDTHAEGYGLTVKNSTINVGGLTTNYAAFIRSRAFKFYNCEFNGCGMEKGLEFYGPDGTVEGCTFNRLWYGVASKKIYSNYSNGLKVFNCTFNDISGPAIYFEQGTNHKIHNICLNNVMHKPGTKFSMFKVPIVGDYTMI